MSETPSGAAFGSLQAMRAVHRDLLQTARAAGPEATAAVATFLARGVAAGTFLDEAADRDVAQGLLDYWQAWGIRVDAPLPDAVLREFDPDRAPALPDAACPYVGLDAFGAPMADRFHGRSRQVAAAVERLAAETFLAVLGPSGSGKSSVVFAGILPRLRAQLPPETCFPAPFVPGSDPLAALARAREEAGPAPAVFVVDQLEELFTLCDDDGDRRAFVAALLALADDPGRRHRVLVTMRTDFETYIVRFRGLWDRFHAARLDVPPLTVDELREAIVAPAATVGLVFESGLPDKLAEELVGQPSSLPLLQFALRRLWDRRRRNRVTWAAYKSIGGGLRALEVAADELYDGLVEQQQRAAKRILLRLVRPGEGLEVTRARVRRGELFEGAESRDWVEEALASLVAARLVRVTGEGDRALVEIGHEALVRNWPRFIEWVAERRDALRARFALSNGALRWNASGREARLLLRGPELREAEAQPVEELSRVERAYLDASARAAARLRRLKWVAAVTALLGLAAIAGLWGWAKLEAVSAAEARGAADEAREEVSRATAAQDRAATVLVDLLEEIQPIQSLVEGEERLRPELDSLLQPEPGRQLDPEHAAAELERVRAQLEDLRRGFDVHRRGSRSVRGEARRSSKVRAYFERVDALDESSNEALGNVREALAAVTVALDERRAAIAREVQTLPPAARAAELFETGVRSLDRAAARRDFEQALQAAPEHVGALTELGLLLSIGPDAEPVRAEESLARAVGLCPAAGECACGRAWAALAELRPDQASALVAEGLAHLPTECAGERDLLEKRRDQLAAAAQLGLEWVPAGGLEALRTEVTVRQYETCDAAGACDPPLWDPCAKGNPRFREPERPVTCIDGSRARQFARFAGGRLPTAEEWGRLARGGHEDGRPYPWGETPPPDCTLAVVREDVAGPDGRLRVTRGCGEAAPAAPCSRPNGNSPDGLCDLIGNVDELLDAESGLRSTGGNWFLPPTWPKGDRQQEWGRIDQTRPIEPWLPSNTVGLRLVRDPPAP
jgi:formylglycine-generating enzyme required for sulfatase activity